MRLVCGRRREETSSHRVPQAQSSTGSQDQVSLRSLRMSGDTFSDCTVGKVQHDAQTQTLLMQCPVYPSYVHSFCSHHICSCGQKGHHMSSSRCGGSKFGNSPSSQCYEHSCPQVCRMVKAARTGAVTWSQKRWSQHRGGRRGQQVLTAVPPWSWWVWQRVHGPNTWGPPQTAVWMW